jgi:hypothetical protein
MEVSMKKVTLLTLAVAMIASLSLSAADDAKPEGKPKRGKVSAEDLKKYDKNGDGKLDKEERAAWAADRKKNAPAAPAPEAK